MIKKVQTRAVDVPSGATILLPEPLGRVEVVETRFNLVRNLVFLNVRKLPSGTLTEYLCGENAKITRLVQV